MSHIMQVGIIDYKQYQIHYFLTGDATLSYSAYAKITSGYDKKVADIPFRLDTNFISFTNAEGAIILATKNFIDEQLILSTKKEITHD
jgi:hypothetical protein